MNDEYATLLPFSRFQPVTNTDLRPDPFLFSSSKRLSFTKRSNYPRTRDSSRYMQCVFFSSNLEAEPNRVELSMSLSVTEEPNPECWMTGGRHNLTCSDLGGLRRDLDLCHQRVRAGGGISVEHSFIHRYWNHYLNNVDASSFTRMTIGRGIYLARPYSYTRDHPKKNVRWCGPSLQTGLWECFISVINWLSRDSTCIGKVEVLTLVNQLNGSKRDLV